MLSTLQDAHKPAPLVVRIPMVVESPQEHVVPMTEHRAMLLGSHSRVEV